MQTKKICSVITIITITISTFANAGLFKRTENFFTRNDKVKKDDIKNYMLAEEAQTETLTREIREFNSGMEKTLKLLVDATKEIQERTTKIEQEFKRLAEPSPSQ
ncbi:hypothetical protein HOD08_01200 [bacterium]|jgi:hypothetical protein|nr:hypothetical protein [bacterium]